MTKSKCIKKAKITFALATILLIMFIEDYYDQQKLSSQAKNLKIFSKLLVNNQRYHIPGISNSTNIQSDKSPPIIKMYIISRKPIYI